MKHFIEVSLGDDIELRQIGKTKCLVRLNGEYATVDHTSLLNGKFILIRTKGTGYRLLVHNN